MELLNNSFLQSGFPIGIAILVVWAIVAKLNKKDVQMECPNHEGAFDCTPFCNLCEGTQEVS